MEEHPPPPDLVRKQASVADRCGQQLPRWGWCTGELSDTFPSQPVGGDITSCFIVSGLFCSRRALKLNGKDSIRIKDKDET